MVTLFQRRSQTRLLKPYFQQNGRRHPLSFWEPAPRRKFDRPRLNPQAPDPWTKFSKPNSNRQPKAAHQWSLSKSQPPKAHSSEPPTLTAEEILTPGKASLKDQPPTGSSDATVKKWLQQYPKETQQMVVKLQAIISESKPKKDEIQTAAVQYGLNLNLVNKMSFSSLLKVISLGALQAAWLAHYHQQMSPTQVLHEVDVIRQFMTHVVHNIPAIAKSMAIWTLGLLHLLCIAEYSAPTFNTIAWQRRLLQLGVSWKTYTYPFFQHHSVVYISKCRFMHHDAPRMYSPVDSTLDLQE